MKSERIKEFIHRAPFAPFDIRTADGRVYTVDHPDFVSLSRHGDTLVYFTEDDRIAVIDCAHIVSLELANRPMGV